jgi:hypothetical protein
MVIFDAFSMLETGSVSHSTLQLTKMGAIIGGCHHENQKTKMTYSGIENLLILDIGQASALCPIASFLSFGTQGQVRPYWQHMMCIPHSFVLTSNGCHLVVSILLTYIPELCRNLHRNNEGTLHPNYIRGCFIQINSLISS